MASPRVKLAGLAAAVNLGAGVALALRDRGRGSDLWIVYGWCRDWLFAGRSQYVGSDIACNYPPAAIVMLSPLALLPPGWVISVWTAASLVMAPILAWSVVRIASNDRRAAIVPVLLFLCWSSTRTLLQFSVLSMILGFFAMRLADMRPVTSGLLLGLALCKPHVAGPIALWTLLTGRLRVAAVAAAVAAGGLLVYDARLGESPLATLRGFWWVLQDQYGGRDGLVGQTSIRAWTAAVSSTEHADLWWIVAAALLFCGTLAMARHAVRARGDAAALEVAGLFSLWSLLAFYHNSNNLILMLPTLVFLWFRDASALRWTRVAPLVVFHAALIAETWGRRAIPGLDRVLVVAAFVIAACYSLRPGSWPIEAPPSRDPAAVGA